MSQALQIRDLLIKDVKRRLFDEGIDRIKKCLSHLTDEQVWYKHNSNINSVGNLILHLCGNVTQYILHGIDGQADIRQRAKEFSEKGPIASSILEQQLDELQAKVNAALDRISADHLVEGRVVQGFDENVEVFYPVAWELRPPLGYRRPEGQHVDIGERKQHA